MVSANDLKKGNYIRFKDRLFQVTSASHIKPGKGGAYVQTEMRAVPEGTKSSHRFRSSETVEVAKIDGAQRYTTLYRDERAIHLMNDETFEQIEIAKDLLGSDVEFVVDGQQLTVDTFEDVPIRVNLPEIVECEIAKIEGIQATGIRAGGSKAHARLTNGIVLECPAHVQPGDRVRVHVAERRYVSKA